MSVLPGTKLPQIGNVNATLESDVLFAVIGVGALILYARGIPQQLWGAIWTKKPKGDNGVVAPDSGAVGDWSTSYVSIPPYNTPSSPPVNNPTAPVISVPLETLLPSPATGGIPPSSSFLGLGYVGSGLYTTCWADPSLCSKPRVASPGCTLLPDGKQTCG